MLLNVKCHWNHTHTYTRLTALFQGLPGWAGTRKVKPMWTLLTQETVSGSGISWAICKSAPSSRQITLPVPHHSSFVAGPSCRPTNNVKALKALISAYLIIAIGSDSNDNDNNRARRHSDWPCSSRTALARRTAEHRLHTAHHSTLTLMSFCSSAWLQSAAIRKTEKLRRFWKTAVQVTQDKASIRWPGKVEIERLKCSQQ